MAVKLKKGGKDVEKEATPSVTKMSLDQILKVVKKEKGDAIAVKGSTIANVERIPTGVFEFDLASGGGFPKGRVSIVYGVESSGKTNLALKAIAYVQKTFPAHCKQCVFVNLEGTFDPTWAAKMGVDVDALTVVNPAYGEEAVDVVDAILRADDLALCVVDSIAVMVASREVAASVEKADVGTAPMLVKRLCNKAVIALAEEARKGHFPALLLINQRRFKVGVIFGDPETMPGGETMKFISSLTVRLYGKNVIDNKLHPELPCWKHTEGIIKKSKVPITASEFVYDMAMIPANDIAVGESDSWSTVSGHLKAAAVLDKVGTNWELFGQKYPNLVAIQERYITDLEFKVKCQQEVVKLVASQQFIVGEQEAAPSQE